jgi:hypothetical protein
VVECDLAKVEVAGSNPVFRSINLIESDLKCLVWTGRIRNDILGI